jgi:hypothetical protein
MAKDDPVLRLGGWEARREEQGGRLKIKHVRLGQEVKAGDLIADEFIYGQVERVSREAPVLILKYDTTEMVPGGADEYTIETVDCSPRILRPGDRLIGALGVRAATLEVVGSWEAIEAHKPPVVGSTDGLLADGDPLSDFSAAIKAIGTVLHARVAHQHAARTCPLKQSLGPGNDLGTIGIKARIGHEIGLCKIDHHQGLFCAKAKLLPKSAVAVVGV